ncbi:MAG: hypothetical protein EOP54_26630, partial [Sphingobacteriales bacterium]
MPDNIFSRFKALLCTLVTLVVITAFKTGGTIVLPTDLLPFKPADYYFAEVTDDREDKAAPAQLVIKKTPLDNT